MCNKYRNPARQGGRSTNLNYNITSISMLLKPVHFITRNKWLLQLCLHFISFSPHQGEALCPQEKQPGGSDQIAFPVRKLQLQPQRNPRTLMVSPSVTTDQPLTQFQNQCRSDEVCPITTGELLPLHFPDVPCLLLAPCWQWPQTLGIR